MSGTQNGKARNFEKQFPGCLGNVVNLLDLSAGVASSRLLTDRPHPNGSPLSRSLSDMATMLGPPFGDQADDKRIVSDLSRMSSNRKSIGTPMKMLLAEEMSKEAESKLCPPNVIAKLMGLDAFPQHQPPPVNQRSQPKGSIQNGLEYWGIAPDYWQNECSFLDKHIQHEVLKYEQSKYRDIYQMSQQSKKSNFLRGKLSQRGRSADSTNEKKMALVREKFMEAKRLATNESLRQSKEFQDALEVLNSNKELFLKFLQEPNSMFSKHLYELQHASMPHETKRITILRPSKMVDDDKLSIGRKKNENLTKTETPVAEQVVWDKSTSGNTAAYAGENMNDCSSHPTQIVVLKPSTMKNHDVKVVVSPGSGSQRPKSDENILEEAQENEVKESEMTEVLPVQIHKNLAGHRRDETLLSSVYSNGYTGDDSSFNKSENEYTDGNLSDSEVMSPPSRHSWDYINRAGSPYSISSFSRASYYPESSVCREAKKRLSERWALMTSSQNSQEPRHVHKESSTLGEMLALSDTKKSSRCEENGTHVEEELAGSNSNVISNLSKEGSVAAVSPKNLSRSKSVPESSAVYSDRFTLGSPDSQTGKADNPKEARKKSAKSSLRGKVSSLFFSRNRKLGKGKSSALQTKDEVQCPAAEAPGFSACTHGQITGDSDCGTVQEGSSPGQYGLLGKMSPPGQYGLLGQMSPDSIDMTPEQGIVAHEGVLPISKPLVPGPLSYNSERPSPISVLEPLFEEDGNLTPEPSRKMPGHSLKTNLIDKSPPIESIARTLSWDDSCSETSASYPLKSPLVCSSTREEELDWLVFVRTLLTAAGFDDGVQSETFISRWHSLESPLDPALRENFVSINDKEPMPEAKRRQRRSDRKLVFDCVNAALIEIMGYGSHWGLIDGLHSDVPNKTLEQTLSMTVDYVWAQMREWFSGEVRRVSRGNGDSNSLVVESLVRNEVVGKGWIEHLRSEMHCLVKEIELKLLDELMGEAVVDLTGRRILRCWWSKRGHVGGKASNGHSSRSH